MYPHGGYKTQTVTQLGNLLAAFNTGQISFRALRLYFAALAAVAAREAAERSRSQRKGRARAPRFLFEELARICGCPVSGVRKELRALERAGLLLFSETAITVHQVRLAGKLGTDRRTCFRSFAVAAGSVTAAGARFMLAPHEWRR